MTEKKQPKLTEIQQQSLKNFIDYNGWHPGGGWVWENRSTTMRIMDSFVRKGLAVQTSDKKHAERFEPTELARTMNAPTFPRPDQDRINAVHVMLAEQGGEWKPGCGWHYLNEPMTKLCLETLVSDGYVSKAGDSYGLLGHGFERAEELGYDPSIFDDEQSR